MRDLKIYFIHDEITVTGNRRPQRRGRPWNAALARAVFASVAQSHNRVSLNHEPKLKITPAAASLTSDSISSLSPGVRRLPLDSPAPQRHCVRPWFPLQRHSRPAGLRGGGVRRSEAGAAVLACLWGLHWPCLLSFFGRVFWLVGWFVCSGSSVGFVIFFFCFPPVLVGFVDSTDSGTVPHASAHAQISVMCHLNSECATFYTDSSLFPTSSHPRPPPLPLAIYIHECTKLFPGGQ